MWQASKKLSPHVGPCGWPTMSCEALGYHLPLHVEYAGKRVKSFAQFLQVWCWVEYIAAVTASRASSNRDGLHCAGRTCVKSWLQQENGERRVQVKSSGGSPTRGMTTLL